MRKKIASTIRPRGFSDVVDGSAILIDWWEARGRLLSEAGQGDIASMT
jgi:hypothetical protein